MTTTFRFHPRHQLWAHAGGTAEGLLELLARDLPIAPVTTKHGEVDDLAWSSAQFDDVEGSAGVLLEVHRGSVVSTWLSDITPEPGETVPEVAVTVQPSGSGDWGWLDELVTGWIGKDEEASGRA